MLLCGNLTQTRSTGGKQYETNAVQQSQEQENNYSSKLSRKSTDCYPSTSNYPSSEKSTWPGWDSNPQPSVY